MSVAPVSRAIEGLGAVTSTPLPPFRALDLLPEVAGLIDKGASAPNDVAMFAAIMRGLGGGKMRELLPQILAGTKVPVTENGKTIPIQLNTVEAIDMAFDGRMETLADVIALAVEVSFKPFLSGLARSAQRLRAAPPSGTSSPNT